MTLNYACIVMMNTQVFCLMVHYGCHVESSFPSMKTMHFLDEDNILSDVFLIGTFHSKIKCFYMCCQVNILKKWHPNKYFSNLFLKLKKNQSDPSSINKDLQFKAFSKLKKQIKLNTVYENACSCLSNECKQAIVEANC